MISYNNFSFELSSSILDKNSSLDLDFKRWKLERSGFINSQILINGSDVLVRSKVLIHGKPTYEVVLKNYNFKMMDFELLLYRLYYEGKFEIENFDSIEYTVRYIGEETIIYLDHDTYTRKKI